MNFESTTARVKGVGRTFTTGGIRYEPHRRADLLHVNLTQTSGEKSELTNRGVLGLHEGGHPRSNVIDPDDSGIGSESHSILPDVNLRHDTTAASEDSGVVQDK